MPEASTTPTAESVGTTRDSTGAWRRAWLTGLRVWAVALVGYVAIAAAVAAATGEGFLHLWMRWDTGHYVTIASQGYSATTENAAFFPLYPLLMRIADPVLPGDMLVAGLVVASAACVAALAVMHRLADDLFDPAVARRTTLALMAFPYAFYLVAAYNESLFLALAAGSLYAMRRGHWWLAGALAGLSTATRQAGVLLALAFAVEYLRQRDWQPRRIRWDSLALLLVPAGLIGYMAYCWRIFDDPLRFMHVQSHWGRELSWPWTGTVRVLRRSGEEVAAGRYGEALLSLDLLDLIAVALVLALLVAAVVGPHRLGAECHYLIAFGASAQLMVLVSPLGADLPPLHGVPRYALEIVPIFLVLARLRFQRTYLALAIALQAAFVVAFFFGAWLS